VQKNLQGFVEPFKVLLEKYYRKRVRYIYEKLLENSIEAKETPWESLGTVFELKVDGGTSN